MLQSQSHFFNLPSDITYLNCSYMSPMLKSVAEIGVRSIYNKEDPTVIKPNDFFDNTRKLREQFAKLLNIADEKHCAIVPSVSYGMATVARNLRAGKGDNIVLADEQFPSNMYAWRELSKERGIELKRIAPLKVKENRGKIWNEQILGAIDAHTKMVAIGHVHWADGTKFDLLKIRKRTREVGAILVIDGTQSIGALPFDVQVFQPDAVVVAGYKWLMGPYSLGMAYFGEYFRQGSPIENNWMNRLHSEDFTNLINYQDEYQPGAIRFEMGESANFILTPMLTRALEQVNAWGTQNIQQYCRSISTEVQQNLSNAGFQIESPSYRGEHLFGIRLPEHKSMDKVKSRLEENRIFVSVRGNSIRVAPHLYNEQNDLFRLQEALLAD